MMKGSERGTGNGECNQGAQYAYRCTSRAAARVAQPSRASGQRRRHGVMREGDSEVRQTTF